MITIISWILYGLVVGTIAKFIHPGDDPKGFLPTVGIGVVGSFIGGGLNWLLFNGEAFSPAGIIMGILGGVIFCWLYGKYGHLLSKKT